MKLTGKIAVCGLALGLLAGCVTTEGASSGNDDLSTENPSTTHTAQLDLAERAALSHDYQTAAVHYKKLLDETPGNVGYLLQMTQNLRYAGLSNEAVTALNNYEKKYKKKLAGNADFLIERGKNKIALGSNDDAIADLEEARATAPTNWDIYMALGIAHDHAGRYTAAQRAYAKALSYSPNNAVVLNNMAMSKAQSGRLAEAISIMEEAARRNRKSAQIRQNLAFLYGLNGEMGKAEKLAQMDLDRKRVDSNMAIYAQINSQIANKKHAKSKAGNKGF